MAKFVIAGICDCPYFARVELLADQLAQDLPHFSVTKIVKNLDEWKSIRDKHGWEVDKSPIIWRELLYQGGRGSLIGGANEFQEYAAAYYDVQSHMSTTDMINVSEDNVRFKIAEDKQLSEQLTKLNPASRLVVIGANCAATQHLISHWSEYGLFASNEKISLHLYDSPEISNDLKQFEGFVGESIAPFFEEIKVVDEIKNSLIGAKQIIFLNCVRRKCEIVNRNKNLLITEEREHWLARRYAYFTAIGLLIRTYCPASVRILVAGDLGLNAQTMEISAPINFDVAVLHKMTMSHIPPMQIVGLVGPLEQRIKAVLATKLNVCTHDVTDVVVWGNIGNQMFVDLSNAQAYRRRAPDVGTVDGPWFSLPVIEAVGESEWLSNEMPNEVYRKRTADIKIQFGLSHAQAVIRFLEEWWMGKGMPKENLHSIVVRSEGWYGVPEGTVFSFPVTIAPKSCWSVVEDIEMNAKSSAEIDACIRNVLTDWAVVDPKPLKKYLERYTIVKKPEESNETEVEQ